MHKITSDEFLENCQKVGIYYQEILTHVLNNKNFVAPLKYSVNEKYQETTSKVFEQIIEHPEKFTDINLEYVQTFQRLISDSVNKFIGKKRVSLLLRKNRLIEDLKTQSGIKISILILLSSII